MGDTITAQLVDRLKQDFPAFPEPDHAVWTMSPAAKVIDCVLSLRMNYNRVVVPRVKRFVVENPSVTTCATLCEAIRGHPSPSAFMADRLQLRHRTKGQAILAVAEHLVVEQARFTGPSEDERLAQWACWTRPGDYLALEAPGFKLAGFQYLRMLLGADTVKPDVHILRYVHAALDRKISEGPAVYLIERAARMLGVSARSIDKAIWQRGAAGAEKDRLARTLASVSAKRAKALKRPAE